jgi:hypothetical protein
MVNRDELSAENVGNELEKDWKFYAGVGLLGLSFLTPLMTIFIPLLKLPPAISALVAGFCIVGAPEICGLVAIALLGKKTWDFLVSKLKKRLGFIFPSRVSRFRYYFGLALNIGSIIPLYLAGYLPSLLPSGSARLYTLISGELIFVASFFVLGGQFWEKFKQLFIYE